MVTSRASHVLGLQLLLPASALPRLLLQPRALRLLSLGFPPEALQPLLLLALLSLALLRLLLLLSVCLFRQLGLHLNLVSLQLGFNNSQFFLLLQLLFLDFLPDGLLLLNMISLDKDADQIQILLKEIEPLLQAVKLSFQRF